jgi:dTDP-4-amino-4,6-dideoxygalactose transaminase
MQVPFLSFSGQHDPIRDEAIETFKNFFDSHYYVLGNMTRAFEAEYAKFNNVKHCVGISNGLDALHLALRVLEIGPGHEVIVPANTYIATALAVSMTGATPVFVEPRADTYNLNPECVEAAITSKTKAIMPVHLYGQACEMEQIMAIAHKYKLYVVEDNAQAQGAAFNGTLTGAFGHINATSFYPSKNLGALGEGGAITTNDTQLANLISIWRNYGSEKRYYNMVAGYNNRPDELQCGLLSLKLRYLSQWTAERQRLAAIYLDQLSGIDALTLPTTAPGATHVYHLFVVRTPQRDALQKHLTEQGIGTVIHYPVPPHLQQAYAHLHIPKGSFPLTEQLANQVLSIPLYPGLQASQQEMVIQAIRRFFQKN